MNPVYIQYINGRLVAGMTPQPVNPKESLPPTCPLSSDKDTGKIPIIIDSRKLGPENFLHIDTDLKAIAANIRLLEIMNPDLFSRIADPNSGTEALKIFSTYIPYYLMGLILYFRDENKLNYPVCEDATEKLYEKLKSDKNLGQEESTVRAMLVEIFIHECFLSTNILNEKRELRINELVFDQKKVRTDLTNEKTLVKVHDWLLSKYDMANARILNKAIEERKEKTFTEKDSLFHLKGMESARWISKFLILIALMAWIGALHLLKIDEKTLIRVFSFLILYLLPTFGIVRLILKPPVIWYQRLLPRLLCGIIIGYLFLMSNEAWQGTTLCGEFLWWKWGWLAVRFFLPLGISYAYLLIEVNNRLKGNRRSSPVAGHRASAIFWQGLFYAVYLGVVFSDLFGKNLLDKSAISCEASSWAASFINGFPGAFGCIYPMTICMLAPLAFFIGIFTQIIWEDKAVTQPI